MIWELVETLLKLLNFAKNLRTTYLGYILLFFCRDLMGIPKFLKLVPVLPDLKRIFSGNDYISTEEVMVEKESSCDVHLSSKWPSVGTF